MKTIDEKEKKLEEVLNELKNLDVIYADPPYNQHPYSSNYFMLNLIIINEEPKKVFTLNMTFENESDWLDMQEIIEQWDIGWLKGVHRSQAETTNDVIESIQNGTAKPTSWRFNKDGSYSYTTGIAHERYNRPY